MAVTIEGRGGRLLDGCRVVTELQRWHGEGIGEGLLYVMVERHRPDEIWWEHHGPDLSVELEVGRGMWTGTARVDSWDPLNIRIEELEDA